MALKGLTNRVARVYLVSADRLVFQGRCLVQTVRLVAGSDAATLKLYDGANTNGEHKASLAASTGTADETYAPIGDLYEQGVYADISGTGAEAVLRILPVPSDQEIDTE